MNIIFFFRKKQPQFNSIEEIFYKIQAVVFSKNKGKSVELPLSSFSFLSFFKNLKYAYKNKGEINHITGHVNYIALVLGKKTILTVHDIGSSLCGNKIHQIVIKILWYWLPALFVKKITVISEFSKKELQEIIPFAKHKIQVIYNPVHSDLIHTPKVFDKQCPTILHIGTKHNKNLENTIKALKSIHCKLHIIGKLTKTQTTLLHSCNINYDNEFYVPYKRIVEAYQKCDILSFASFYEGFGMPIIEAQSVGRVVLTSNIGAMKEISGTKSTCLVNPKDTMSIKKGFEKIIVDDTYRESLISHGLKNIKRFSLSEISDQYLKLYEGL